MSDKNATFDNAAKALKGNVSEAFNKTNFKLDDVVNKTIGEYTSKKENRLLVAGISSILFGNVMNVFVPYHNQLAEFGFYGLGGLTILVHLLEKSESGYAKKLFLPLGLFMKINDDIRYPKVLKKKKTDYGYILRIKNPTGITSKDFISKQLAIEEYLGHKIDISYNNKCVWIKVFEKQLLTTYPFERVEVKKDELELVLGIGYSGPVKVNLADSNTPHALIGGNTGSGKSVIIRGILTNLILNYPNVDLYLIDLKRVELKVFDKAPQTKIFANDITAAKKLLKTVMKETQRRYKLFEKHGCVDIKSYNKKSKDKLNHQIVMIEEYAEIAEAADKESLKTIQRLVSIARACGIHVIPASQRLTTDIITGTTRANFGAVIGLRTKDEQNSRYILGEKENDLAFLRGKGHGILKIGSEKTYFQSMFLSEDQAKNFIKDTTINNNNQIAKVENVKVTTITNTNHIKKNTRKNDKGMVKNFDFTKEW